MPVSEKKIVVAQNSIALPFSMPTKMHGRFVKPYGPYESSLHKRLQNLRRHVLMTTGLANHPVGTSRIANIHHSIFEISNFVFMISSSESSKLGNAESAKDAGIFSSTHAKSSSPFFRSGSFSFGVPLAF